MDYKSEELDKHFSNKIPKGVWALCCPICDYVGETETAFNPICPDCGNKLFVVKN